VSVYGQDGPYRDRPGLDRNGIAMGGLLHLTGYPDRPPVRPGVIISDYLTGIFNALSVMIALYHRDRPARRPADGESPSEGHPSGGRGQVIDLALYASVLRILEHTVAAYDRLGIVRCREGNRLANSAPLDNWETSDGQYVSIVAAGDGLFPRLARLIGRPELPDDPRFAKLAARVRHSDEINAIVAGWCRERTAAEIERLCLEAEVPFARCYDVADICADPQIRARGDLVRVEDPVLGPILMQGLHAHFSETPGAVRTGAPRLGEHNEEIYGELLGLDGDEIAALREEGVV